MPRLRPLTALLALSPLKARMQGHWKRPLKACRPHSFTLQRLAVCHPPSPRPLRSWHTTRLAANAPGLSRVRRSMAGFGPAGTHTGVHVSYFCDSALLFQASHLAAQTSCGTHPCEIHS